VSRRMGLPIYCIRMDTQGAKPRVLVVDDEKIVADTFAMILQMENYESRAVYSAEQAVEILDSFDPGIVVSDIVMGPMSGFDLAIYLAEHRPDCRVILVSGHAFHQPEVARTIKHGFEFLTKPVEPADLLARLALPEGSAPNQDDTGVRQGE